MECEKKWQPLCLANGISHIGIPTGKLDESKAFYQALGFQPVLDTTFDHSSNRVSFLECSNLCLELYESDDVQGKSGAIDHFALDVEDIQTVMNGSVQTIILCLHLGLSICHFLNMV